MSGQSQKRCERGYALIEAMVGGVVLMVALGSVLSGMSAARQHVTRSVVDQLITQQLVDQAERIRALPRTHAMWNTVGNNKACLAAGMPAEWTCGISVFADTDSAVGGAAGPLTYRRAVVTLTFAGRSQSVSVLK